MKVYDMGSLDHVLEETDISDVGALLDIIEEYGLATTLVEPDMYGYLWYSKEALTYSIMACDTADSFDGVDQDKLSKLIQLWEATDIDGYLTYLKEFDDKLQINCIYSISDNNLDCLDRAIVTDVDLISELKKLPEDQKITTSQIHDILTQPGSMFREIDDVWMATDWSHCQLIHVINKDIKTYDKDGEMHADI